MEKMSIYVHTKKPNNKKRDNYLCRGSLCDRDLGIYVISEFFTRILNHCLAEICALRVLF